jgi:putative hydrolase of the HAD superfamily
MTLSMIEAAFAVTEGRIGADDLHRIVGLGKEVMAHPVALLPGIREAVAAVAHHYPVVLVTKGDLFHQEAKVAASGLAGLFRRIEIVSEKDAHSYARLLAEFGVEPDAFAMVGNSLRSDIEPVVRLGGWGVHVPYHVTWAHELDNGLQPEHERRIIRVDAAASIPKALAALQSRAQSEITGRD